MMGYFKLNATKRVLLDYCINLVEENGEHTVIYLTLKSEDKEYVFRISNDDRERDIESIKKFITGQMNKVLDDKETFVIRVDKERDYIFIGKEVKQFWGNRIK